MASRWLLKTDPRRASVEALLAQRTLTWRDVTQPQALAHLRRLRRGDEAFVYAMGRRPAVVGLARVRRGAYPDPARDDPALVAVDLAGLRPLARPVGLGELKGIAALAGWDLVRIPRLSVMPVPEVAWRAVLALARRPHAPDKPRGRA